MWVYGLVDIQDNLNYLHLKLFPSGVLLQEKKKKKMGEKEKVLVRVKIGLQRLSLSFSSKSGQYLLYKSASLDISLLHQLW